MNLFKVVENSYGRPYLYEYEFLAKINDQYNAYKIINQWTSEKFPQYKPIHPISIHYKDIQYPDPKWDYLTYGFFDTPEKAIIAYKEVLSRKTEQIDITLENKDKQ
jgi:hypothetical protein